LQSKHAEGMSLRYDEIPSKKPLGVFRRETASGFYPWGKCEAFHFAPRMFFVFDSIHDSATMHNLYPGIFH